MQDRYDRTTEDLGNITGLEHVNLRIPDQQAATLFYVTGLGLTRDPYLMTGIDNMWVNVGRNQFHLPTGNPMVLRGLAGIVVPDREALLHRLAGLRQKLEGTRFDFEERDSFVDTVCPWGNRIRCHGPEARFGRIILGMPYVEFAVGPGSADGIARFYRECLGAPAEAVEDARGRVARVPAGIGQDLLFRETDRPLPPYDGHHIQIYVADFSGPYSRLLKKGLITEESSQHQYRFSDIVDPETGKVLFTLEHEVRSMRHPLHGRPLVNRNPAQTNRHYAPGHDALTWSMSQRD